MTVPTADLQSLSSTALYWIGHALLFGTLLAALTWLSVKTVLRSAKPAVHSALWMIVLLKFVIPVGPSWTYSLATSAQELMHRYMPAAKPVQPVAAADSGTAGVSIIELAPAAANAVNATAPATRWSLAIILASAYLLAVAVIGLFRLGAYIHFSRQCRRLPKADASVFDTVMDICRRLSVRRMPDVRLSDDAPAPFVFGAVRPTLVLSRSHLVRPDELEAVVLHEIAHLRRGDLFVRYVQWLAGTLLFFWPIVAWVNRRIDLARELACDEWALRHGRLSAAEYARCLLRALHPARIRRPVYMPAAMAANLFTVERRIEMILDTRRTVRGSLGIPAALLLAAWGGFVLTGARAASAQSAPQNESKDKDTVIFRAVPDDGDGATPVQGRRMMISKVENINGQERHLAFAVQVLSEKELAAFLVAHPTADANGDGKLTTDEHDAFLVALAMSDPAAVLAKYPNADGDKDGQLSVSEAIQLVQGGPFKMPFTGQIGMRAGAAAAGGNKDALREVRVHRIRTGTKTGATENGKPGTFTARLAEINGPSKWLVDNITGQPTARDVARYVGPVADAPMIAFYQMHPEADTNNDGKVSNAEREAFMDKQMAEHRAKILKQHPEADTNGDGVLSQDEMMAFAKANGGLFLKETNGKDVIVVQGKVAPPAEGQGEEGAQIQIEVESTSDDDTTPPPQN